MQILRFVHLKTVHEYWSAVAYKSQTAAEPQLGSTITDTKAIRQSKEAL